MAHYQRKPARVQAWQVPPQQGADLDAIAAAIGGRACKDALGVGIELPDEAGYFARAGEWIVLPEHGPAFAMTSDFLLHYELVPPSVTVIVPREGVTFTIPSGSIPANGDAE